MGSMIRQLKNQIKRVTGTNRHGRSEMTHQWVDLAGAWELREVTDKNGNSPPSERSGPAEPVGPVPVAVPGDTHSALLAAEVIPDPYWGGNEIAVQWVGERDWSFTRTFALDADDLSGDAHCYFRAESLDTVAAVTVNGHVVAETDNMFVPVDVDITDAVRAGENEIAVLFRSADREAARRAESLPYPVPHQVYDVQSMHRNLVRKVQCHSGWDWGPALMVAGIYGEVGVLVAEGPVITAAYGYPRRDADTGDRDRWILPVTVEYRAAAPFEVTLEVSLFDGDRSVAVTRQPVAGGSNGGSRHVEAKHHVELTVESPSLWWPNGYGEQPLYRVNVRLGEYKTTFSVGFRTIQLINEDDDTGRSMYFRVNGRDLWAKGMNWIPSDSLPLRQRDERYAELLSASREANMNMVRVWGGGQYERQSFYDLCDQLGLLVWQDFMFSCSLYPSTEWFLDSVALEAEAQTKRLLSHPSIAIWCGNNENLGALGWFDVSIANPGRYLIDFDRLYNGVVGKAVRRLDPGRPFWPSSPAAGEGDFSDNWHDDSSGDMHYWSVWHEGKSFDGYYEVTPRFCSEFGFQSFPSLHSIRTYAPESHFNPTAPLQEHHQRSPRGNTVVAETMARYFRFPFDFADFVYISQVQQAMAIQTAVDYWRSRRPHSMGALYWQLNDVWPVVSWSSLEYDGRWKLLHFAARRFFEPVRVVAYVKDEHFVCVAINDTDAAISGDVTIRFLDWAGGEVGSTRANITVAPDSAEAVSAMALGDLPADPTGAFAVVEWSDVARTWTFLTEPKRCELIQPRLIVTAAAGSDGDHARVTISAEDAPAFWTTVESTKAEHRFSENGFLLLPGERRDIDVSLGGVSLDTADLTVRHLRSTY